MERWKDTSLALLSLLHRLFLHSQGLVSLVQTLYIWATGILIADSVFTMSKRINCWSVWWLTNAMMFSHAKGAWSLVIAISSNLHQVRVAERNQFRERKNLVESPAIPNLVSFAWSYPKGFTPYLLCLGAESWGREEKLVSGSSLYQKNDLIHQKLSENKIAMEGTNRHPRVEYDINRSRAAAGKGHCSPPAASCREPKLWHLIQFAPGAIMRTVKNMK